MPYATASAMVILKRKTNSASVHPPDWALRVLPGIQTGRLAFVLSGALGLVALPCLAQSITFSLATDLWSYSSGPSTTGFATQTGPGDSNASSGRTTKGGVTVNFGASFVGGAASGTNFPGNSVGSSMTRASGSLNPNGFLLSTIDNGSPGLPAGITGALTGEATRYQRWYFEFSTPVILEDFILQDIDNLSGNGGFRDIVGAEAYADPGYVSAFPSNGFNPGLMQAAGSGMDPVYALGGFLSTGTLTLGSGSETLLVAGPIIDTGNPSSTPEVRANIRFGSTPVRAFSVYAISNQNNVHRMALNQNSFTVTVPEPSVSLLGLVGACGLVMKRRR